MWHQDSWSLFFTRVYFALPRSRSEVARGLPSRGAVVRCLGLADPGATPLPLRRFCLRVDVAAGDGCQRGAWRLRE